MCSLGTCVLLCCTAASLRTTSMRPLCRAPLHFWRSCASKLASSCSALFAKHLPPLGLVRGERKLFWDMDKSPQENKRIRIVGKAKRFLCEQKIPPGDIITQARRGLVWAHGKRVLEVRGDSLAVLPAFPEAFPNIDAAALTLWVQEQMSQG